jgi:hypothetical protein
MAEREAKTRGAVFFLYSDEAEQIEHEGLRLSRCRLTVNDNRSGRFEGLRVEGFDEATQVHRLVINGRRVWLGAESPDESGTVFAPRGEQWRVGCGSVLELLMRGHFERVAVVVEMDPPPPAAVRKVDAVRIELVNDKPPCELCRHLTLVDVPRSAIDPADFHHPQCSLYVKPRGAK